MKCVTSLLCGILLTASSIANAGVWYKWQATNDAAPLGISLLLEFDHAVVRSGALRMQIDVDDNWPYLNTIFPQSGLLSFFYETGTGGGIYWNPRKGITDPGPVILDMDVGFGPGKHLTGSIYAHNFDSQFGMSTGFAGGPNFIIYEADSDAGMNGCGGYSIGEVPCIGATGQIGRVPEPVSIALLGLGAFSAALTRRRSAKQKTR
jgi:hypothetical protein